MAVLLITHYQRLLNYITPDRVHVMVSGGSCVGRAGAGATLESAVTRSTVRMEWLG